MNGKKLSKYTDNIVLTSLYKYCIVFHNIGNGCDGEKNIPN